jgi:acyl-CoA thioesterase
LGDDSSLGIFDRATALAASGSDGGVFTGVISEHFWVQAGPNGGYLAAIAQRGAGTLVDTRERPARSLHARFLSAPKAGPFELRAELIRAGRSMSTVGVRMSQDGRDFLHASACFSGGFSSIAFQDAAMPEALPVETSHPVPKRIPLNHRYDLLRAIGGDERADERARSGGWIRFAEPRAIDELALAALWDAWPPAVFARAFDQRFRGAVPTVEVSVYFRRRLPLATAQAGDYVLLCVESTMADEGIVEESGEIWSRDGLLLAQSRQLALLM